MPAITFRATAANPRPEFGKPKAVFDFPGDVDWRVTLLKCTSRIRLLTTQLEDINGEYKERREPSGKKTDTIAISNW